MSRTLTLVIAGLLAAPALAGSALFNSALAATPINETRPLDARGRVLIENLKGSIEVRAWERNEVKIEGSLGQGVEKLEITGDRQHLSVRVKYPKSGGLGFFSGSDKSEPSQLRLMVPLQADLEIDAVSADIDVAGVAAGELSIDSVSGDVNVVGAPREATIDSVSGDLKLILNSATVSTESVSGDIDLRGRLGGEVHVETVSGDIDVAGHQSSVNKLTGTTVSGDIRHRHRAGERWPHRHRKRQRQHQPARATQPVGAGARRKLQRRPGGAGRADQPSQARPRLQLRAPLRHRRWRHLAGVVLRRCAPAVRLSRSCVRRAGLCSARAAT